MELLRDLDTEFQQLARSTLSDFVLIDIGCAGGIDAAWRRIGNKLTAYCFDLNVENVAALNESETLPGVRYIDAVVEGHGECNPAGHNPWARLAVQRTIDNTAATRAAASSDSKRVANDWKLVPHSNRRLKLREFFASEQLNSIDFLKIDVDGPDFDILLSMREVFASARILGVGIEVNWFGSADPQEHSFHNTDRFMRELGFDLYDFTKRTYAMASLPTPYALSIPAQSVSGRPLQGDAVYLRDLGARHNLGVATGYSDEKLLKLALLQSMIGQPDSAADTLVTFRDRISKFFDVNLALDLLVRESPMGAHFKTYRALMEAFDQNDPSFYSDNN